MSFEEWWKIQWGKIFDIISIDNSLWFQITEFCILKRDWESEASWKFNIWSSSAIKSDMEMNWIGRNFNKDQFFEFIYMLRRSNPSTSDYTTINLRGIDIQKMTQKQGQTEIQSNAIRWHLYRRNWGSGPHTIFAQYFKLNHSSITIFIGSIIIE